jgi:hypothetical protein
MKFQIQVIQHREWFIVVLLPHIQVPLTRQKFTTHSEVVEITMHLESMQGGDRTSKGIV